MAAEEEAHQPQEAAAPVAESEAQPPPAEEDDDGEEYKAMAESYKNEGNDAFKVGDYHKAVQLYSQGVDIDPDNHILFSNRSAAYLKINERGKALKDAERLMELQPEWPKSFSRKAAAQHALTRYHAAMETYREGLSLFPDDKSLQDGLKAAEEAYEVDKKVRFEQAAKDRELEAERRKEADRKLEEAKAKAASKSGAGKKDDGGKAKEAVDDDPLMGFFSEVGVAAVSKPKPEKVLNVSYAKANLGTSQEQIDRVLQVNYQWKNLNPYDVLQLDTDATEEDIKLRYRKLSTLVHPDKCLTIENAREAFEEVKKAYFTLMEEERRRTVSAIIDGTRKRILKERKHKISKGVSPEDLGPEDEALKKAVMKEFAEIEMRKRNSEKHEQAFKQYEQKVEDEQKEKFKKEMEFEKKWSDGDRMEGRVSNWRDFQKGPAAKRAKVQSWNQEENAKDKPKFGSTEHEGWKKKWK